MCAPEMGKSVLVWCLFFYFSLGGSGASASNGENVAMGRRGVERLRKLCALLDKNGNARLGWWTRRLHVAALPYLADYPTSSSFSTNDQEFDPSHSECTEYPEGPEDTLINTIIHHTHPSPYASSKPGCLRPLSTASQTHSL
jgi:hypothetical protein